MSVLAPVVAEAEFLKQLICQAPVLALLYQPVSDGIGSVLDRLIRTPSKNPANLLRRNIFRCVLRRFWPTIPVPDLSSDLTNLMLVTVDNDSAKIVARLIAGTGAMDQLEFPFVLLAFAQECPALAVALRREIEALVERFGVGQMWERLHATMLDVVTPSTLFPTELDSDVWAAPIYSDPEVVRRFQALWPRWPEFDDSFPSGFFQALANAAVETKQHFIEVAGRRLAELRDVQALQTLMQRLGPLGSVLAIVHKVPSAVHTSDPSVFGCFLRRRGNDAELAAVAGEGDGSIPARLVGVGLDQWPRFIGPQYLCATDEAAAVDFDFMRAFLAMHATAVWLMDQGKAVPAGSVGEILAAMSSRTLRAGVADDIYSLLFARTEHAFLVGLAEDAATMARHLLPFSKSGHIARMVALPGEGSFAGCFKRSTREMWDAAEAGDFDRVRELAALFDQEQWGALICARGSEVSGEIDPRLFVVGPPGPVNASDVDPVREVLALVKSGRVEEAQECAGDLMEMVVARGLESELDEATLAVLAAQSDAARIVSIAISATCGTPFSGSFRRPAPPDEAEWVPEPVDTAVQRPRERASPPADAGAAEPESDAREATPRPDEVPRAAPPAGGDEPVDSAAVARAFLRAGLWAPLRQMVKASGKRLGHDAVWDALNGLTAADAMPQRPHRAGAREDELEEVFTVGAYAELLVGRGRIIRAHEVVLAQRTAAERQVAFVAFFRALVAREDGLAGYFKSLDVLDPELAMSALFGFVEHVGPWTELEVSRVRRDVAHHVAAAVTVFTKHGRREPLARAHRIACGADKALIELQLLLPRDIVIISKAPGGVWRGAGWFLVQGRRNEAQRLIAHGPLPTNWNMIFIEFGRFLADLPEDGFQAALTRLESQDPVFIARAAPCVLRALATSHNWRCIPGTIVRLAKRPAVQVQLFAEHDALAEALGFAEVGVPYPRALIGHRAVVLGLDWVVDALSGDGE